MSLSASNPSVFYIIVKDPDGQVIPEGVNPLAEGINIVQDESGGEDIRWGYVSWYDKLASDYRTLQIKEKPSTSGKNYFFTDLNNYSLAFKWIDKKIYDHSVKSLLLEAPELKNDEDVQGYLMNLNPFDNNL